MKLTAQAVKDALQKYANAADAVFLQRYFKTGEGQYGAGDVFIGVRMPQARAVCKVFRELPLNEVQKLLDSPVHEHRIAAVVILVSQFSKANEVRKAEIYDLYLYNVRKGRINNWDIVDISAPGVVGAYLLDRPHDVLLELAKSSDIWQRRVAVMSTFAFLRAGDPTTSLQIAELLWRDSHDLIQKAVGWMLREVGKHVDRSILTQFLDEHARQMPRTMLRYSIEHLPPDQRAQYLAMKR